MMRRLFTYMFPGSKCRKSLSLGRISTCQFSNRSNDTGPKRTTFAMVEEREAQEFLDNLDEIMQKRKKRLEDELEEKRLIEDMPEKITAVQWKILLTEINSAKNRLRYYRFIRQKEYRVMNDKEKKKPSTEVTSHRVLDELTYPSRSRVRQGPKYSCYKSMVLGNPIVFDMDFDITFREQTNTMEQILFAYGINMRHSNPFHLHITGYKNTRFGKLVEHENLDEHLFASFHENSFLDIFDIDRLVYLTPDGPLLKNYDAKKIYVIGAMVDLHDRPRFTLGKTRELDVECGRLPLERYVRLKTDRALTLTAMMSIMLHANLTNDWKEGILQGLPRTKYRPLSKGEELSRKMNPKFKYKTRDWQG